MHRSVVQHDLASGALRGARYAADGQHPHLPAHPPLSAPPRARPGKLSRGGPGQPIRAAAARAGEATTAPGIPSGWAAWTNFSASAARAAAPCPRRPRAAHAGARVQGNGLKGIEWLKGDPDTSNHPTRRPRLACRSSNGSKASSAAVAPGASAPAPSAPRAAPAAPATAPVIPCAGARGCCSVLKRTTSKKKIAGGAHGAQTFRMFSSTPAAVPPAACRRRSGEGPYAVNSSLPIGHFP